MRIQQIMSVPVYSIQSNATLDVAAHLMWEHDCGAIPVTNDKGKLVGIVTDRDIAVRHVALHHDWDCSVEEHMTAEALVTIEPWDNAFRAIRLMKDAQVRRIPVIDPDGRLLGIVALADIALRLGTEAPGTVEDLLLRLSEPEHVPAYA